MKKVAMIGVGKLGQDCAEVMAEHYDVVGFDVETRTPLNFEMKNSIKEAVEDRDIIFIAAPTPHDPEYGGEKPTSHLPNKDFDYTIVVNILSEVNKYVNKTQLVVLISTVLPGTVRRLLKPYITNARFVYNPYLIAMGTIKWDMVNPEMVIIGTEDGSLTGDANELIDFYKLFMQNNPRYEVGTWDEAESIKIFYNTFISAKLSLVNMIQDVAEINGNINVDVVTNALAKSDYRIMGPAYMKAGMGDAGACHPRDNIALRFLAEKLNLGYDLFDSIMTAREVQAEQLAKTCLTYGKRICVLGKAYKPGVPYTNGSYSLLVGHYIEQHGGNVIYYDLNTGENDHNLNQPDVFLIGYWDKWVEDIFLKNNVPANKIVIDPWRKLDEIRYGGTIIHYGNTRPNKKKIEDQEFLKICTANLWPEVAHREDIYYVNAAPTLHNKNTFLISKDISKAINNGFKKIFFYNVSEPIADLEFVKVDEILSNVNINSTQVYYLTATENCQEIYNKIVKKHNLKHNINIVGLAAMQNSLLMFANQVKIPEYKIHPNGGPPFGPNGGKLKKFLCFNKIMRLHRVMLIGKLMQNNLLEHAYVSTYPTGHLMTKFLGTCFLKIKEFDKDLFDMLMNNQWRFPLEIDSYNENRQNPINFDQNDIRYYEESFYSVVTETLYFKEIEDPIAFNKPYSNSITFTEKTFKPIAMRHPFILVGPAHMLKYLRAKGYKTFHPLIDESYDDEEDDIKRLDMIINEIKRMHKFNRTQWINWQTKMKEIVDFNHDLFFNTTDFKITKDVKI